MRRHSQRYAISLYGPFHRSSSGFLETGPKPSFNLRAYTKSCSPTYTATLIPKRVALPSSARHACSGKHGRKMEEKVSGKILTIAKRRAVIKTLFAAAAQNYPGKGVFRQPMTIHGFFLVKGHKRVLASRCTS